MELEFLKLSNFSLLITPEELVECGDSLLSFSLNYKVGQSYGLPPLLGKPHIEFRDDIKAKESESNSQLISPLNIAGKENLLENSSSDIHQLDDIHTTHIYRLPSFQESTHLPIIPFSTELLVFSSPLSSVVARRVRIRNVNTVKQSLIINEKIRIQKRIRKSKYGGKIKEWSRICAGALSRHYCIKCRRLTCRCKPR
jgi:hypothetical protein